MSRYFRSLGAGTTLTADWLSRRGQLVRSRTRPKSFHAQRSAETCIYSRFSFINQVVSFHATPPRRREARFTLMGVDSPFSRLIGAVVNRDSEWNFSTRRKRKGWNHGAVPSRYTEEPTAGSFQAFVRCAYMCRRKFDWNGKSFVVASRRKRLPEKIIPYRTFDCAGGARFDNCTPADASRWKGRESFPTNVFTFPLDGKTLATAAPRHRVRVERGSARDVILF